MKIAICGNYGVSNTGDEAILKGLTILLKQVFPGCEIEVFGKGRLFPVGFRSFFRAFFTRKLWSEPLRALKACDMFIIGGGGLFCDEEAPFVSLFWALQGLIAHILKKPLLIIGVSVGPVSAFNRPFVRHVFKIAKLVTVRDAASQKLLEKWGINSHETSDLSLLIPYEPVKRYQPKEKYIVLSVRPFKNYDEKMSKIFAQFCDEVIMKYGFKIRFMPFQIDHQNDSYILNKIFDQVQHKSSVIIDHLYTDVDKLIEVLSGAEIVVAMRLHAAILTLLGEAPFLPVSYMKKSEDFWAFSPEIHKVKLSELSLEALLLAFRETLKFRKEASLSISNLKTKLLKRAFSLEKLLK